MLQPPVPRSKNDPWESEESSPSPAGRLWYLEWWQDICRKHPRAETGHLGDETVAFNSSLLRPRVIGEWIGRAENDADPLAAEMLQPPVPRSKNDPWESEESSPSPAGSLKMEPKTKGLKQQQQQHKKLLAAMLSQDSFESVHSPTPSVIEEDIDNEDDAMELLGNFKN
ncbi:hypothetical protein LTLLF_100680 [Microtus ochrogaster]|uniref:Uncharacterized protein n=1 Tax=Microtus ochrogaster TaxID=79684 RepID=A0A8J6H2Z0_MICOH|nr:hypothetical protein LTLLF_100680 [Microtus ochrogaster]